MTETVRAEIESLHEFFVSWFSGAISKSRAEFDLRVTSRMADDFAIIQPSGERSARDSICDAIFAGHGSNSDFRIAIRNFEVRLHEGGLVLATYQEWQRNARHSIPPDNGRAATVLFRSTDDGLRWVHVHETWLPGNVTAAAVYDF